MKYKINLFPRTLHFEQPAGTSRGIYLIRNVWYIQLIDLETGCYGIGECAPLPNLSCDDIPDYKTILSAQCNYLKQHNCPDYATLYNYPSILFGIETALQHLRAGSLRLWDTSFSQGLKGIPINGLIWMGNSEEMLQRINEKIQAGTPSLLRLKASRLFSLPGYCGKNSPVCGKVLCTSVTGTSGLRASNIRSVGASAFCQPPSTRRNIVSSPSTCISLKEMLSAGR